MSHTSEEIIVIGTIQQPGDPNALAEAVKTLASAEAGAMGVAYAIQWAVVIAMAGWGKQVPHSDKIAAHAVLWAGLFKAFQEFWKRIADDPPQTNFRSVVRVPPVKALIVRDLPDPWDIINQATAHHLPGMMSVSSAVLDALERLLGAWDEGDEDWKSVHGATLSGLLREYDLHKTEVKKAYLAAAQAFRKMKPAFVSSEDYPAARQVFQDSARIANLKGSLRDSGWEAVDQMFDDLELPESELERFTGKPIHNIVEDMLE